MYFWLSWNGSTQSRWSYNDLMMILCQTLLDMTLSTTLTLCYKPMAYTLLWRHNEHDSVSNYQPHSCLLNRLFRRRSKKTSKPCVTGLCVGNSPGTGEFPAQRASNAENVSIWWRHHVNATFKRVNFYDYRNPSFDITTTIIADLTLFLVESHSTTFNHMVGS